MCISSLLVPILMHFYRCIFFLLTPRMWKLRIQMRRKLWMFWRLFGFILNNLINSLIVESDSFDGHLMGEFETGSLKDAFSSHIN